MAAGALIGLVVYKDFRAMFTLAALVPISIYAIEEGERMKKKRVFVSFDFDNDVTLKHFIVGQAKNPDSPFEINDCSLKEAAPEPEWQEKARQAIRGSDIVLVIVGQDTYRAQGVLKEIGFAREAGVKIVQIIGRKDSTYTPVPNAGRLYAWSWENLKSLCG